jgi:plastocyanin
MRGRRFRLRHGAVAALAALFLYLPSAATAATTVHVGVQDFSFTNGDQDIAVGDSVEWDWISGSHTTTSDATTGSDVWNSPINNTNPPTTTSFTHQFNTAGSFSYHCNFHASMHGTVVVGSMLGFSGAPFSVGEGDVSATITVHRGGSTSGSVSVTYNTTDGTATAGQDYTNVSGGTLTWADGVGGDKTFDVPITDDADPEPNETVHLSLSSPQGGSFIGTGTATLSIVDNDAPPATYQPDALVKGPANSSYKGDGIYNTFTGQTTLARVAKGNSAKFYVKVQNDGTDSDTFAIKGKHGNTDFSIRYFHGATNITNNVVAGAKQTPSLPVGTSWIMRVVIAPKRAARVGDVIADVVSALSNNDPLKKDAAQLKAKVVSAS